MADESLKRIRRPRYHGTHPRAFHEKYKELNPEQYAADVAKVVASGKTPAGSHRPIMVAEILDVLAPQPGDVAVDATLGYGGHSRELLQRILPGGRLLALDVDPIELPKTEGRLRAEGFGTEALVVRRSNYAGLLRVLAEEGLPPADVILADLGLSSMQIDNPARGFTFKREGPLDLRMNPDRGRPASALLASLDPPRLARMLDEHADQRSALPLAQAIIAAGASSPIMTTTQLAGVVRGYAAAHLDEVAPGGDVEGAVRRVFQALRIAVNEEFTALETFLRHLPDCVASGGRIAILTFHSGEDRRVKQAFKAGLSAGIYQRIAENVELASPAERQSNPRSSSAKLRWAIRR
ncbi:MAG: 16S rRNA (cytosine(1402)-N(4))-methyltransferase RsmH [Acidobacteria bacterium]|nr:16S rRNA (cytosine(1402)-N(4))-methyltransferase RsmH [Acidobacteriota bacterium]